MTTSKSAFEGNARAWLRVLAMLLSFTCTVGTSRLATAAAMKDRAKKEFAIAEKFYKMGEFSQAVDHYKKAYDLAPFPAFLFNLGQCYKQLDNCERAVFYYSGYLREKPDAPNATVVTKLIAECRTKLAEDAKTASRELAAKADAGGTPPTPGANTTGFALTDPRAKDAPDNRGETAPKSVLSRWWFWGTVAGVVAAGAATTAVLVWGRREEQVPPSGTLGAIDAR